MAKGEISNLDTLVTWLESIENFIGRLIAYSGRTLPPAMVEIVVKIMVELISTLALMTKILKGRKRGVPVRPCWCITLLSPMQTNLKVF